MKISISILLLAGIACLWFLGNIQPIVIASATADNRLVVCAKCAGTGSVEVPAACPKCRGSGKGEWHFKSGDKGTPFGSKPACLNCKGTGKISRREKCAPCQGTGRVAAAEAQKPKTARADLSLLEKILLWMRFAPNTNCRPQRRLNGAYPLVVKYVELTAGPAHNARVVKWEPARLEGQEWIIKTVIEFTDKNGQRAQEGREFIVENREVKGSRGGR